MYGHPKAFVGRLFCLTSQQHASVSQEQICSDSWTCCHTEVEVSDQTFYLTQSQYTDAWPTSPSADPTTPGAWQGSQWSANLSHWYESTPKKSPRKRDSNPGPDALEADALTTWPKKRSPQGDPSQGTGEDANNRVHSLSLRVVSRSLLLVSNSQQTGTIISRR